MSGAHDRNRTGDLVLTKDVLYRLSYVGRLFKLKTRSPAIRLERVMGIEPTYSAWKAEVLPLNYTRKRSPVPVRPAPVRPVWSQIPTPLRYSLVLVEGEGFEPSKA